MGLFKSIKERIRSAYGQGRAPSNDKSREMGLENNKKQGFIPGDAVRASNEARNPAPVEKAPGANTDMYSQERVLKNQPATDASDDALGG